MWKTSSRDGNNAGREERIYEEQKNEIRQFGNGLPGNSEYGLVTEERTEALYFGIKKMLDKPELIVTYSQKAKQRREIFKKQGTVESTEKFFEQFLLNKAEIGI